MALPCLDMCVVVMGLLVVDCTRADMSTGSSKVSGRGRQALSDAEWVGIRRHYYVGTLWIALALGWSLGCMYIIGSTKILGRGRQVPSDAAWGWRIGHDNIVPSKIPWTCCCRHGCVYVLTQSDRKFMEFPCLDMGCVALVDGAVSPQIRHIHRLHPGSLAAADKLCRTQSAVDWRGTSI